MSASSSDSQATRSVDVAIIGAGTAGQNAFKQARKQSDDIVIINEGFWTTTCATVGCMPSKLLIAAGERAHHAKASEEFGVKADINIDGKQVMKRVQALRDYFTSHVQDSVDDWPEDKKISGRAYINSDGLIEVNDELIKAKHVIVATGSTPFVPEGWQDNLGERLYTSDTIFEIEDLPTSLAVVGAGAIGLELAQSFSRLGVEVTLLNRANKIGGLTDPKVNEQAIKCLSSALTLKLGIEITAVALDDDHALIHYQDESGKAQCWQGDAVLVATGRRNELKALGVEHLGVELDKDDKPKDLDKNTGQISNLPVYVIGDANAHLPLLHVASDEGYSAGASVCDDTQAANLRPPAPPLSIVFCEPQIANVGQSLKDIKEQSLDHVIGEVDFGSQGRSRIMGVNCGLLRVYACKKTDKILGASMVAPDAEYIAHILATAITNELTVKQLLDAPFYHPTILEGLRTALRQVQDKMDLPHQSD
ncbi:MAG: dihydrolipoyl dehydrogenase [Psychrobacter sp.]|nr:dihydrolipoyl dehydrogenase [Psychrobacter sp.]